MGEVQPSLEAQLFLAPLEVQPPLEVQLFLAPLEVQPSLGAQLFLAPLELQLFLAPLEAQLFLAPLVPQLFLLHQLLLLPSLAKADELKGRKISNSVYWLEYSIASINEYYL